MMHDFIHRYALVVILAIAAGVCTLVPQLVLNHALGDDYAGVRQEMIDDEEYYMARQQEVLDGYPTLGNPYLYEHKDEPGLQVWIPDALLAWGSSILFGDIHTGALFWDFSLPMVIVLLTYAVTMLYTRDRTISLTLTLLTSVGLYLQMYTRSPSPQLNFIFFLAFLALVLQAIITRSRGYIIAAGLSLGALFYVYTYYWTYAFIFLGVACVASFALLRGERMYEIIAKIIGAGLILGIPYFLTLREASSLPYYQESLARVGMITTHSPSGLFIVAAGMATLGLMAVLWRLRILAMKPLSVLAASGVLGGIIATNQHLITGLNLEFSTHYHWVSMYADFFAIAVCVRAVLLRENVWSGIATRATVATIVAFSVTSAVQLMDRQTVPTDTFRASQRYAPVLTWLKSHTEPESVVYADTKLSHLIPAYTSNNVFYNGNAAMLYIMPQTDVRTRFLAVHYFDTDFTRDVLISDPMERHVYGNYYIEASAHMASLNKLRRIFGLAPLPFDRYPEEDMAALIDEWHAQKRRTFTDIIAPYRVDYVVWDKMAHPQWRLDQVPGLHEAAEVGDFVVYTFTS